MDEEQMKEVDICFCI